MENFDEEISNRPVDVTPLEKRSAVGCATKGHIVGQPFSGAFSLISHGLRMDLTSYGRLGEYKPKCYCTKKASMIFFQKQISL